jgi:inorganic pyrophosphatase/exopolyphosphatase
MHDAHQIEVTDEVTFFKLHDLDGDGFWDEYELKSMYGLERDIDPNATHIKLIIDRVYKDMDMNKDRFISMDEYITSKLPSLSKKEEKQEEEWKQEEETKKKKYNQKVIVNNKRKTGPRVVVTAGKDASVVKQDIFKQEGANYVPSKFRA